MWPSSKCFGVVDCLWDMVEAWREDVRYFESKHGKLSSGCLGGMSFNSFGS
jgi:hypothetical protein